MKFNNYMYFIGKRLTKNFRANFFASIITIVCFLLISFTITFYWLFYRAYNEIDVLLPTGIKNAGIVQCSGFSNIHDENAYFLDILEMKEVAGIASFGLYLVNPNFYYNGNYIGEEILELSQKGLHNYETDRTMNMLEPGIECIAISNATVDYFGLKLCKGEFDENHKNETSIVLGYNYIDVPVGTVLRSYDYKGNEIELKVVGILEKGSKIIDSQACANSYSMQVNFGINLDNMMLSIDQYSDDMPINRSGAFLISFEKKYGYENGMQAIRRKALEYNSDIIFSPAPLYEKIKEQLSEFDILLNIAVLLIPVSLIITIIIIISSQLIILLESRNEIGIWISNGLTSRNIFRITFFEIFIKMLISSLITGVIFDIYIKKQLMLSEAVEHYMFFDLYLFSPLCLIIMSIILSFLIIAVSFKQFYRKSVPELIKNTWE